MFCLPNLLLMVLITLFAVATIQVALFHVYGGTSGNAASLSEYSSGHPYLLHGGGSIMSGYPPTPLPRVNLAKLLNRNVPTMLTSWRDLKQQLNTIAVNRLIEQDRRQLVVDTPFGDGQAAPHGIGRNSDVAAPLVGTSSSSAAVVGEEKFTGRKIANVAAGVVAQPHGGAAGGADSRDTPPHLPACPQVPPGLKGPLHVDTNNSHFPERYTEAALCAELPLLKAGGVYSPPDCISRYYVAIVIPYRDRKDHLMTLLGHLHPILQRQQISYRIFVVEQQGERTFNKARIMNIAFVEALKLNPAYECFVFHDVDLIPEDDRNLYACPAEPRHMSPAIDEFGYQNPYDELVGGVLAIRTEHFFKVNGYSNLYWGWGAEDDDMAYRIAHVGLRITRPPTKVARYKTVKHKKRPAVDGRIRYRLLYTGVRRYKIDGLNSLSSLNYKIISIESLPLYTHILVDIGPPPPGF